MEARIINGTSVSRIHPSEDAEGELLAAFQYDLDAIAFAKAKIAEDARRDWKADYVVACSLTGKVRVLRGNAAKK